MLKSRRTEDTYQNVYLSNLKILSTTRHNTITSLKLFNIDSALRDIQGMEDGEEQSEEVSAADKKQPEELPPAEELDEQPHESPQRLLIPILMSIQYHDTSNMISAVEGFLRDYRDVDGNPLESEHTCPHCNSTEVQHASHIAEISHWRKSLMSKLNLKTSAYT